MYKLKFLFTIPNTYLSFRFFLNFYFIFPPTLDSLDPFSYFLVQLRKRERTLDLWQYKQYSYTSSYITYCLVCDQVWLMSSLFQNSVKNRDVIEGILYKERKKEKLSAAWKNVPMRQLVLVHTIHRCKAVTMYLSIVNW